MKNTVICKRKKIRALVVLLALLMTAVFVIPAYAQSAGADFEDVEQGRWYCVHIDYMYGEGLMKGTSAKTFSPSEKLTKAMIVQILYKIAGTPAVKADYNPFTDVENGRWYTNSVLWSWENGLIPVTVMHEYMPHRNISRANFAKLLLTFADHMGLKYRSFIEAGDFSDWEDIALSSLLSVRLAQSAGIVSGKPGNVFDPGGDLTRAEAAAMIHMFLVNTVAQDFSLLENNGIKLSVNVSQASVADPRTIENNFAVFVEKADNSLADIPEVQVTARITGSCIGEDSLQKTIEVQLTNDVTTETFRKYGFAAGDMDKLNSLTFLKDEILEAQITVTVGSSSETYVFYPNVEHPDYDY